IGRARARGTRSAADFARALRYERARRVGLRAAHVRRGIGPSGLNARKTLCAEGHLLSGSNPRITTPETRECVECRRAWNRKNMRRSRTGKRGQHESADTKAPK